MFFTAVTRALVYVYGVCWYIVARRTAPAHIVSLPGPENLIPGTSPALRSGPAAGGRRPAELCLARTETCNSQLVAGYLACGRVADCASNAPPGSRSRRFLDVEDQAGDLLLVEGS